MLKLRSSFMTTLGVALAATIGGPSTAAGQTNAQAIDGQYLGVGPAVRDLAPTGADALTGAVTSRRNPLGRAGVRGTRADDSPADLLLSDGRDTRGRTPATDLTFEGVGNPVACGGCTPPDTTGDVGPNHYIQMVNATKVAIFNKSGTPIGAPFDLSTIFATTSCSTDNAGDPQVLYDQLADRWVLAQFQLDNRLCIAVSQEPNPTLSRWFLYSFATPEFPDYFKLGVWPTGYYVSTNESTYTAYALDRTAMLAGSPASAIRFPGETNFLMPADVDGPTSPDSQGGIFYTFKDSAFHGVPSDRLQLFRLTPNFTTPAASTFTNIANIPVTPFTYTVCGFFVLDCIPQPGTSEGVDAVSEWPMQRLAYRRFAGHETLIGNFTVDVGSDRAGIRWFELRNTGGGYTLFQEGTHAPADGLHRFMGSIAMDGDGNIALGYSVSSGSLFPGIRYATRNPGDPPGTLQAEQTLQAGGGSQTSTANRWGDYSAMNVDPADDCSFWYTNQYYSTTSTSTWRTRIGRFREASCAGPLLRSLTVSTAGTGSGFVDSVPTGIDCGLNTPGTHTDCAQSYADGTLVTLTAHPDANTDFVGFSGGGCSGSTTTCNVPMNAAQSVTATFAQKQRQLTVTSTGLGSGFVDSSPAGIDCGVDPPGAHADCAESYGGGTVVTLTAHPDANTDFVGFSGGGCSGSATTCNVAMNSDQSVTATFAQKQRQLTVTGTGPGSGFVDSSPAGIDCGVNPPGAHADCAESYNHGTAVTLTAHAREGSDFTGFSGAGCSTSPCTVTMDAAKSVAANFVSHEFRTGKVKRNKKKGTATIPVTVPGGGELALTGKQIKPQRPARAPRRAAPKPVAAAGTVNLKVKAKGKAKRKLASTGKVKVKVKITYTPTGGTSASETLRVKLNKL